MIVNEFILDTKNLDHEDLVFLLKEKTNYNDRLEFFKNLPYYLKEQEVFKFFIFMSTFHNDLLNQLEREFFFLKPLIDMSRKYKMK